MFFSPTLNESFCVSTCYVALAPAPTSKLYLDVLRWDSNCFLVAKLIFAVLACCVGSLLLPVCVVLGLFLSRILLHALFCCMSQYRAITFVLIASVCMRFKRTRQPARSRPRVEAVFHVLRASLLTFFFFFILRRIRKNKALAHHISTYFLTRRVSI